MSLSAQFLSILPGGNTAATPLVDLGQQDSNVYVWNANVREYKRRARSKHT